MPSVGIANGRAPVAGGSIDLPLFDVSFESVELGKKLVHAAAQWGFLWIAASPPPNADAAGNAGYYNFNDEIVDSMFSMSKEFFIDAPLEEKQMYRIKDNKGWVDMHIENLDPSKHKRGDFKQAFNLSEQVDGQWLQPIPAGFKQREASIRDFHARCRRVSTKILRLLALGLEIPDPNWLAERHDRAPNTSRLLYYPRLPADTDYSQGSDIRAGAHSDYGSITLLFQRPGQPGLELLTPEGRWASVPIFPVGYHSTTLPPVVVNIGDLLSYWTNGVLKSTVHRVILTEPEKKAQDSDDSKPVLGEDRLSIAIFVQPRPETEIVAMPSPVVAAREAEFERENVGYGGGTEGTERGRVVTAGEHLDKRLVATYGAVYQPQAKSSGGLSAVE